MEKKYLRGFSAINFLCALYQIKKNYNGLTRVQ